MNTIHQSSQKNPDLKGRFGSFGGRFVPETLMHALDELESAFLAYKDQEDFENELLTFDLDAEKLIDRQIIEYEKPSIDLHYNNRLFDLDYL